MNKVIDTKNKIRDNEHIQRQLTPKKGDEMNTVFTTTTKNYDVINVIVTHKDWYEVYFNNTLQQECISFNEALREVERQLSL